MVNLADITKAIEQTCIDNLDGYIIERNGRKSVDPNEADIGTAWLGIYRGGLDYVAHTTGTKPWLAQVEIILVLMATGYDGADAEDKLQEAERDVVSLFLDPTKGNLDLGGTVDMVMGSNIEYVFDDADEIYWHSAKITIKAEVRA